MDDRLVTNKFVGKLAVACCLVGGASRGGLAMNQHYSSVTTRTTFIVRKTAFVNHLPLVAAASAARVAVLGPRLSCLSRWRVVPSGAAVPEVGGSGFSFSSDSNPIGSNPALSHQDDLAERVKAAIADLPRRPRCAVVGGGFAGLATAYHLTAFGSDVTIFDPNEVGTGGSSAVAAGLLHPLTPRGKLIWKGEEGLAASMELIEVANARLSEAAEFGGPQSPRCCLTVDKVYRPLFDDKQYNLFIKAAEELPQWVEHLTREEFLEAVPGSDTECLGGVRIRGALALDAPTYLKGLWEGCRRVVSANRNGGGGNVSAEGATWVRQRVDDIHALASSGEFNAVIACVGAGVKRIAGMENIASLRLVRGQTLLYDNVDPARKTPTLASGTSREDPVLVGKSAVADGEAKGMDGRMLTSAVLCGQYVVPAAAEGGIGNEGKLMCGSTQEPVLPRDVDKPADMAQALRQLAPKITKLLPALKGMEPVGVSSGVRVIQDRTEYGRIPIAGRLPFSKRGWVIAALGARGLIHHAYLGRLIAACALLDSDQHLPPQVVSSLEGLGEDSTADL